MTNKKISYLTLGIALVALLALPSCNTNKQFVGPETVTEGLYRNNNSEDSTTVADIPWKGYFTDTQLQALIEEGLAQNTNMQVGNCVSNRPKPGSNRPKRLYFQHSRLPPKCSTLS
jgi:outer membrane protein, multidrug efflux system